jgi:hypothetical protein
MFAVMRVPAFAHDLCPQSGVRWGGTTGPAAHLELVLEIYPGHNAEGFSPSRTKIPVTYEVVI